MARPPSLKVIKARLREIGLHYLGSSIAEAEAMLIEAMTEREGMPDCYGRSYRSTDDSCTRCEVQDQCASAYVEPRIDLGSVDIKSCSECDGELTVELMDDEGSIRDYGCSSHECNNTLRTQQEKETVVQDLRGPLTGDILRSIRESLAISGPELARRLGISIKWFEKLESMKGRRLPDKIKERLRKWLRTRS